MSLYSLFLFTFDCSSSFSKSLSSSKRCIYDIFLISTCGIFDQFLHDSRLFPEKSLLSIKSSPHILVKALIPSPYINAPEGSELLWFYSSVPSSVSISNPIFISGSVIRKFDISSFYFVFENFVSTAMIWNVYFVQLSPSIVL